MKQILGTKLGMTQCFDKTGVIVPVTVVQAGPVYVIQEKTIEKDGYEAVKVAYKDCREKNLTQANIGELKKAGLVDNNTGKVLAKKYFAEICSSYKDGNTERVYKVGDVIDCTIFNENEKVDVQGVTRGRGFTGAIQRWNQHRHPMTHGVSLVHRASGSMGANSTPSRVFKGKHLAGHYGHETVTIQNLRVVKVDKEHNVLLIKGGIPGPKGGLVTIKSACKA